MTHKGKEPKAIEEALDQMEELVQTFASFDEHEDVVQALGDAADTARGMGYVGLAMNSYALAVNAIQCFLDHHQCEVPGSNGTEREDSSVDPVFMKLFKSVSKRIASESAKRAKDGKRHGSDDPEIPG